MSQQPSSTSNTINTNSKTITHDPTSLTTPPNTDIWRKPPSHNVFNAPTYPSTLPIYPLSKFVRARVTFSLLPLGELKQYDQAGLLLHLTHPNIPSSKAKWVKTGVEIYNKEAYLATVGCDTWADWNLVPFSTTTSISPSTAPSSSSSSEPVTATIEATRESDELGKSLWIYALERDAEGKVVRKRPLREVTWVFADEEDEGWSVGVGAYACRPSKEGSEELVVEFKEGIEVEVLG